MLDANTQVLHDYENRVAEAEKNFEEFRLWIEPHIKAIQEEIESIKGYANDYHIDLDDSQLIDLINE